MKRYVPEQYSTGGDRHNAQKAWLAGYDTGISTEAKELLDIVKAHAEHIRDLEAERDNLLRTISLLKRNE